jgi:hypothetical protein
MKPTDPPPGGVAFKDKNELARTFNNLAKTSVAGRKAVPNLAGARSLVDTFESLRDAHTKEEASGLVARHKGFFQMIQDDRNSLKLAYLRSNPILACVADETGRIRVGDHAYDIFDQQAIRRLTELIPLPPPPVPRQEGAYTYTEDPPEDLVEWLPCGPWTVLPGYPTSYFDTTINGRRVLVQLWKGLCPDYLGRGPGGIGAEVGLYKRDRWLPKKFWWPDYHHKQVIEFSLMNPKANDEFFSAGGKGKIWWLHKWMKADSYAQYMKARNDKVPAKPADYVLHYKINGQSFTW